VLNRKALSGVFACLCVATCQAQNLLDNPDFPYSYYGWKSNGGIGNTDWVSSPDHSGGQSGSIRLRGYSLGSDVLYQCIDAVGGASYTFGAWSYQPSGQTCSGGFTGNSVRLWWYDAPACPNGSEINFIDSATAGLFDQWQPLAIPDSVAPATTRSALIVLSSYCGTYSQTFTGYFDDAFVSSDIVFRDRFD
jgi:hypothetical protein